MDVKQTLARNKVQSDDLAERISRSEPAVMRTRPRYSVPLFQLPCPPVQPARIARTQMAMQLARSPPPPTSPPPLLPIGRALARSSTTDSTSETLSTMPSLTLDDFGALVAATLDAPGPLDLSLSIPVHSDPSRRRPQSQPRSHPRPALPTLFTRPSPLNIPLSLGPETAPSIRSPRTLPLPLPVDYHSGMGRKSFSRPASPAAPLTPTFSTFTLPRGMGLSPASVSTIPARFKSPTTDMISTPITSHFDLNGPMFTSPRAPPSPPSGSNSSQGHDSTQSYHMVRIYPYFRHFVCT
jgi:hypothetical protein